MSNSPTENKSILLTIFLTVFIDMLGITIIIPVIPALFFEPETAIFSTEVAKETRSLLYGLLIGVYPLMQFFGAPVLGAFSDKKGRKPMLMLTLIGTIIGYLLFATAIGLEWIGLLFFARMIPGFMGGKIAIILSSIADVSDNESKAKNFGLVGAAFGIGFIMGPMIGGILADSTVVSWFSHQTPFWFTAGLAMINFMLVYFTFPETLKTPQDKPITIFQGFKNIRKSFAKPKLRSVFSVVLLISSGFFFFTQFFAVYLISDFGFSEKDIGFLFGWVGVWLAITQAVFVRMLSKKYKPQQILMVTPLLVSMAVGLVLVPREYWMFFLVQPLIAIAYGMTNPNLTALVSIQASDEEQGEILGIQQSMNSLGQIFPPLIGGYLAGIATWMPIAAGSFLLFLAWVVFIFFFRKK